MLDGRSLKRLEDLQTENKRLTKKLSELAVVIAVLKLTETRAALSPSGTLESRSRRIGSRRVARPATSGSSIAAISHRRSNGSQATSIARTRRPAAMRRLPTT